MPGDLMTTSQSASFSSPPSAVATTSSAGGLSSTRTAGGTPSVASLRRLAWPSTPRPQTPTRRPARSDQLIVGGIRGFDEVAPEPVHQRVRRRRLARLQHLGAQDVEQRVARAVVALGGHEDGGAALADVPDALERLEQLGGARQGGGL